MVEILGVKYKFNVKIGNEILTPKGIYYQGKYVVLVGCTVLDHTIRRKVLITDAEIDITKI